MALRGLPRPDAPVHSIIFSDRMGRPQAHEAQAALQAEVDSYTLQSGDGDTERVHRRAGTQLTVQTTYNGNGSSNIP